MANQIVNAGQQPSIAHPTNHLLGPYNQFWFYLKLFTWTWRPFLAPRPNHYYFSFILFFGPFAFLKGMWRYLLSYQVYQTLFVRWGFWNEHSFSVTFCFARILVTNWRKRKHENDLRWRWELSLIFITDFFILLLAGHFSYILTSHIYILIF